MSRLFSVLIVLVAVLVLAVPSSAQQPPPPVSRPQIASDAAPQTYDTPPAITLVDGAARLIRQGQTQTAVANMPLVEGDRVATDSGRVAVTYPDGSQLRLDRQTTVDFLSLSLMRLLNGRIVFVAAGQGGDRPAEAYQVDTPGGSVQVQAVGEYHVSATDGNSTDLAVVSGVATLMNARGNTEVDAGQRARARADAAPENAQSFNSASWDAFDRWSADQGNAEVSTTSAQYLPPEVAAYSSEFDRYGQWENTEPYGYVWYPTVSAGWRPYYNGYWDEVGPYGWTWVGYDAWAWPTHHFGHWGIHGSSWFWIPGRYWAPAWVSWAFSNDYVSWCPLDYYNRPLFGFFGSYGYRGHYDGWRAWTVVPRRAFGSGFRVAHYAVDGGRLGAHERAGFDMARGGPGFAGTRTFAGPSVGSATPRALASVGPRASTAGSRLAFSAHQGVGARASSAVAAPRGWSPSSGYRATARSMPGVDRPAGPMSSPAYRSAPQGSATPYRATPYRATPYQRAPGGYSAPRSMGGVNDIPVHRGPSIAPSPGPLGGASAAPRYSRRSMPSYQGYSGSRSVPSYSRSMPGYSAPSRSGPSAAPRASAPSHSAPSGGGRGRNR